MQSRHSWARGGLFIPAYYRRILGFAEGSDPGVIGSIAITMRDAGPALSMALYAAVFIVASHAGGSIETTTPLHRYPGEVVEPGFRAVFVIGTVFAFGVLLIPTTETASRGLPAPADDPPLRQDDMQEGH